MPCSTATSTHAGEEFHPNPESLLHNLLPAIVDEDFSDEDAKDGKSGFSHALHTTPNYDTLLKAL
jgi:hypothetical protein